MLKRRRQYHIVKYMITYKSGKSWYGKGEVLSYSEIGARDVVRWLFKDLGQVDILSVTPTFKYVGEAIYPSSHVIGDL